MIAGNEHVKLAANLCNAMAVAALISSFVSWIINTTPPKPVSVLALILAGLFLHLVGELILRYIVRKD